ncbi:hypothetical protein, partial [uncultured Boseongicola sp.]|uniref:hypothetical protein n=1 Tax=uncultured Boseongicola sp. TaxID=1648499 RepID=UPI0026308A27
GIGFLGKVFSGATVTGTCILRFSRLIEFSHSLRRKLPFGGPALRSANGPKLLLRDLVIAAWQLQLPGGNFAYVALSPKYIRRS